MIFVNSSTCPLCGECIDELGNIVTFPALTSNIREPLFIFSDNSVHEKCLLNNDLKNNALWAKEMYDFSITKNRDILKDHNALFTNLLTSNREEPLFGFNFLVLNKNSIIKWSDKDLFLVECERFIKANKWESFSSFNMLEYLIEKIHLMSSDTELK